MKKTLIGMAMLLVSTLTHTITTNPAWADPAPPVPCNRECLSRFVDVYLDALAAQSPARAPFAHDARFTENGVELALGDALWTTFDKAGSQRLIFADPDHQSAVVFTPIIENGNPAMLAARLKMRQHQIVELETMVVRKRNGFFNPDGFAVERPIWSKPAGMKGRLSRSELVRAADSYFNGIVEGRGDITPFDPDCWRYENGVAAVRNPKIDTENHIRRLGCKGQFDTGILKFVTSITNRRYLVVDVERQIVVAAATFNHRANVRHIKRRDTGKIFDATKVIPAPYSYMIMEAFKLENGRIKQIEAILQNVPYKMPLGWPLQEDDK